MHDPAAPLTQAEIVTALGHVAEQEAHAAHAMRTMACGAAADVRPQLFDVALRQDRRASAVGAAYQFLAKLWGQE